MVTPTALPPTALIVTGTIAPDATGNYYDSGETYIGAKVYKRSIDDAWAIWKWNAIPERWGISAAAGYTVQLWLSGNQSGPIGDYPPSANVTGTATVAAP